MGQLRYWMVAGVASVLVLALWTVFMVSGRDDRVNAHRGSVMMGTTSPVRTSGEYGYLAHMVAHHREAIAAASQLARSQRPEMRTLGADIVASQSAQVDQMVTWIKDWYPSEPAAASDYQPSMRDLSDLTGDELDRAFLTDMVPHHMMAVMMSQRLLAFQAARHDQVTTLARHISAEQHVEIVTMTRWLRTWFGQSAPGMHSPMMGW